MLVREAPTFGARQLGILRMLAQPKSETELFVECIF